MEIQDFRCFVVLSEELNFRRAAEKLNMSQPPLTRLVKRLEQDVGVALFNRTTRTVELTEAGQYFLQEARAFLLHADETARRIRHATANASNHLKIGYVPIALHTVMSPFLNRCRSQFPQVELDLRERSTDRIIDQLHSAEIDIGFLYMPAYSTLLEFKRVYREPMALVVPADHAMADRSSASLREFANDIFVLHPRDENPAMHDEILRCCTIAGFSPRTLKQAHDQTCMALLLAGQGIHFVASGLDCLGSKGLHRIAISDTAPALELAIAWRKEDPSAVVKSLVSNLSTVCSQLRRLSSEGQSLH
ncbi:HTH-type transcriptional regulator CatM [Acaryochloris thomasi RCC1774]|uniref:HTH-type transcriptional regulator CatM n=1 Tax=Acaryochloris thomasi RCC1774 TaxID=1764569 RepID=A0A2W1JLI7_9CYAN|nr:LysR family transcriptional regulator [Acaryochloris thomasi]PZD71064.1 HTH-type transcriptional regulator CatM [Acaryochloris thomasi RCC1774]